MASYARPIRAVGGDSGALQARQAVDARSAGPGPVGTYTSKRCSPKPLSAKEPAVSNPHGAFGPAAYLNSALTTTGASSFPATDSSLAALFTSRPITVKSMRSLTPTFPYVHTP